MRGCNPSTRSIARTSAHRSGLSVWPYPNPADGFAHERTGRDSRPGSRCACGPRALPTSRSTGCPRTAPDIGRTARPRRGTHRRPGHAGSGGFAAPIARSRTRRAGSSTSRHRRRRCRPGARGSLQRGDQMTARVGQCGDPGGAGRIGRAGHKTPWSGANCRKCHRSGVASRPLANVAVTTPASASGPGSQKGRQPVTGRLKAAREGCIGRGVGRSGLLASCPRWSGCRRAPRRSAARSPAPARFPRGPECGRHPAG
ncbi:MAG: hypothetical protein JWN52_7952 [Actinomycetia bacterium]|nr:hypothetical protein [Actinomycetes bacterium]